MTIGLIGPGHVRNQPFRSTRVRCFVEQEAPRGDIVQMAAYPNPKFLTNGL
jgi:hypothetical protein